MPRGPAAFREKIIALARARRGPKELANEFVASDQSFRNWSV
jgi:hypothetical protein